MDWESVFGRNHFEERRQVPKRSSKAKYQREASKRSPEEFGRMRIPHALTWTALLAVAAVSPSVAVDSHSVQSPVTYAPVPVNGSEDCDPSKWTLPVDAKYNTKGKIDPHKLNVHLIAHSHDDPYVCWCDYGLQLQTNKLLLGVCVEDGLSESTSTTWNECSTFWIRWCKNCWRIRIANSCLWSK